VNLEFGIRTNSKFSILNSAVPPTPRLRHTPCDRRRHVGTSASASAIGHEAHLRNFRVLFHARSSAPSNRGTVGRGRPGRVRQGHQSAHRVSLPANRRACLAERLLRAGPSRRRGDADGCEIHSCEPHTQGTRTGASRLSIFRFDGLDLGPTRRVVADRGRDVGLVGPA
jgi:hypothetical protein